VAFWNQLFGIALAVFFGGAKGASWPMKANTNVEWLRMSIGERASAVIAPTCVLIAATAGVVGGFVWLDKTRNDHALTNVGLPLFVFGINIDLAIQGGRAKTNKAIVQNPPQGMHFSKRGGIEVILIPAGKFRMGDQSLLQGRPHRLLKI